MYLTVVLRNVITYMHLAERLRNEGFNISAEYDEDARTFTISLYTESLEEILLFSYLVMPYTHIT